MISVSNAIFLAIFLNASFTVKESSSILMKRKLIQLKRKLPRLEVQHRTILFVVTYFSNNVEEEEEEEDYNPLRTTVKAQHRSRTTMH